MPTITHAAFGEAPGQGKADLFTLTNAGGHTVKISNYGATLTSIIIDGSEMIIGFDTLDGYLGDQPYYGALIGRYGNRIAGAAFELNGERHELVANEQGNQLHGGPAGFDKKLWVATPGQTEDTVTLLLSHVSPDGDMGFPGEIAVRVAYTWGNDNSLTINYSASSTKDTILNLTNHAYFNIGSEPTIKPLLLRLAADRFVPIREGGIPTGKLASVLGTPFDFTSAKVIGEGLRGEHPQLKLTSGYDHTFVVRDYDGTLREAAKLTDPSSGRTLTCLTTEPGIQVFTANFEPNQFPVRNGGTLPPRGAICLETQHFPDSPNQPNFRTPLLRAGNLYETTTVYRFS